MDNQLYLQPLKGFISPITIAYNMKGKRLGCVLLRAVLGATIPAAAISRYFEPDKWELSPAKLQLYRVNTQEEFEVIVRITNF